MTLRAVEACRRAQFNFQSWMSLSGDAKPKCLLILGDFLVFEEARGGAVQICTRTRFSRAQPFLLESYGLVTSHQCNYTSSQPLFFGFISVYKYRYSLCDTFYQNVPSLTRLRTPYEYCAFRSFQSEYELLQISHRMGFSARLRSCNHLSKVPRALI